MLDPLVKVQNVRSVTGFDPLTTLPSRQVQITYMVGTHGPFVHVTDDAHFTPEYLERVTGQTAATLRAAGATGELTGA